MSKNANILIIDDDPDFRLQLQLQLQGLGHSVVEAEDATEGWKVLQEQAGSIDLVIVDLMMEESDAGFTFCYRAKKNYPDLPVVIATAVGKETGMEFDSETKEERNWIKADKVIDKPIRTEQLEKILNELFN
ncbi:MAG: response regulator [Lentisphaerae bacterium]|nr:MAG: response regulator [Lentisphaerota bacterium]